MKKLSTLLGVLTLFTFAFYLLPMLHAGLPITHDGEGHVARAANYYLALKQGQIPPRWAPSFWNGYGYPVLNFYYPLLSILSLPLIIIKFNPELVVKIIISAALIALGTGTYLLLKTLTDHKSALFGSTAFWLSPYLYTLIYVRGAFGELLALVIFVWFLYLIQRLKQNHSTLPIAYLPAAVGLLALSHNIMGMVLIPVCLVLLVSYFYKDKRFTQLLIAFTIGIGLSLFFLLPALFEKKYTIIDQLIKNEYRDHFATFTQLLDNSVDYGTSRRGDNNDTMSLGVGTMLFTLLSISLFKLLSNLKQHHPLSTAKLVTLLLALLLALAMQPLSLPIWDFTKPLQYFQFPWRLLGFEAILTGILGSIIFFQSSHKLQLMLIGIAVILIGFQFQWPKSNYVHYARDYYLSYVQTSTVQDESRAKTFALETWNVSTPGPTASGSAVSVQLWNGSHHHYQIESITPVEVTESTMYFPGWETKIDGQLTTIDSSKAKGQIHFTVPAGTHQITTKFTQNTPIRLVGNIFTVLSIGIYAWFIKSQLWQHQQQKINNLPLPRRGHHKFKNSGK